ncbi:MAG: hypothetical protein OHK0029_20510 [Armatimonadaceae bacterium]
MDVKVHPEHQGNGYGAQMFQHIADTVGALAPSVLRAESREHRERERRFLEARGFVEEAWGQESALAIEPFDPSAFQKDIDRVLAQGIAIKNYAELVQETTDLGALHWKLDDLYWAAIQDIPNFDQNKRMPHEEFVRRYESSLLLPEGQVFAVDGDRVVGMSVVWKRPCDNDMDTGTTGVLREYRHRGIATALKVTALTVAKQYGAKSVRTSNAARNTGMLGINRRLVFVPKSAWIIYIKEITPEALKKPSCL